MQWQEYPFTITMGAGITICLILLAYNLWFPNPTEITAELLARSNFVRRQWLLRRHRKYLALKKKMETQLAEESRKHI